MTVLLGERKIQGFYDSDAEYYDHLRFKSPQGSLFDRIQKSLILKLIGDCEDKFLIEIGCGTGRFTKLLVENGARLACVDISRRMLLKSRLRIGSAPMVYSLMNGKDIGFKTGVFDGCLAINVFNHLQFYDQVLEEIGRLLKSGGFLVANFPNLVGLYFPVGILVRWLRRSIQAPVYSRWYSFNEISKAFEKVGLMVVELYGQMLFPRRQCPRVLLSSLLEIDALVRNSKLKLISGNFLVRARKI